MSLSTPNKLLDERSADVENEQRDGMMIVVIDLERTLLDLFIIIDMLLLDLRVIIL